MLVDVILPLPLNNVFSYYMPPSLGSVRVGCRVIVQFGKKKYYTAIVVRTYEGEVSDNTKEVIAVLDGSPIILQSQLDFWNWIAFYYMCSMGEVYKAALPSVFRLQSETVVSRNNAFEVIARLTPIENNIYRVLDDNGSLRISDIENILKLNNAIPHVKSLSDKGAVRLNEVLNKNYAPKTETRVMLAKAFSDEELVKILDNLKKAKKQYDLFVWFLSERDNSHKKELFFIPKKELLTKASVSVLNALTEKNILRHEETEVSRIDFSELYSGDTNQLNLSQQKALDEIKQSFENKDVTLLHGVTSSGKTEVYIQLIKELTDSGKQVLYLVPEIALTTQLTERLGSVFGDKMLVYHSRYNDNERAETWKKLLSDEKGLVVLGARSSVFLPFSNLGLIVVDEEHESSYKQQDPAPRYNARDAAVILSNIHNVKVLLGTATPSIETYHNAKSGKYDLVTLRQRHEGIALPKIVCVDVKTLRKHKQMKSALSPILISEMKDTLSRHKQAILFQNRRGFAPLLSCKVCAWTPHCENCDVSLTYHKGQRVMVCHYCGAAYKIPDICPNCETPTLDAVGYGTERIEEEVKSIFSDSSVVRMDLDTTKSKRSYEKIISDLENGKTDILIGTQMVTKGLDFDNVSLVGILNADTQLNFPDFRAHEKSFQQMTQVSGRSGRKGEQGLVVLQTAQPKHPVIDFVLNNDYEGFYKLQSDERRLFDYPPFCRLISVSLKSRDADLLHRAAAVFADALRTSFGKNVLGPSRPVVSRVQSLYVLNILLKIRNNASPKKVREAILHHQRIVFGQNEFRSVIVYFDVDPLM
ncbi:MAG: primosomal protein N' [Dysgonomonas sp.]